MKSVSGNGGEVNPVPLSEHPIYVRWEAPITGRQYNMVGFVEAEDGEHLHLAGVLVRKSASSKGFLLDGVMHIPKEEIVLRINLSGAPVV